jgi:hypothetical protein
MKEKMRGETDSWMDEQRDGTFNLVGIRLIYLDVVEGLFVPSLL